MTRRQGGRWGDQGGATRAGEEWAGRGPGAQGSLNGPEQPPEVHRGRPRRVVCLQETPGSKRPPRAEVVCVLEAWLEGVSQRTPLLCVCVCVCARARVQSFIYVSETY